MTLNLIRSQDIVPPPRRPISKLRLLVGGLLGLLLSLGFCLLFHSYIVFPLVVQNTDMVPTLNKGDWIYVWRSKQEIRRGSVVLLSHPKIPEYKLIRRVIALPEETIDIYKRRIYINSQLLQTNWEQQAQQSYSSKVDEEKSYYNFITPLKLKRDEIIVLADNRKQILDSRTLGAFSLKQIEGIIYTK